MKNFTAIICTLTLLTALTGCNNNETSGSVPESVSAPDSTTENTSDNSDSSGSSDNSESEPESSSVPEQQLSDEQSEKTSGQEDHSFVGPDGESVWIPSGQYDGVDKILFDFAYVRYARPYFYTGEYFEDEERETLPEMKWFKVREGDKLNCGLTVKKAELNICPYHSGWERMTYMQTVELDGEITLEGMLFATTNPNDYASKVGDLNFIVDPTKTEGIPVVRLDHDRNEVWYNLNRFLYPGIEPEYIESDVSNMWYIGNIDDDNFDESSIFGGDKVVHVKATLENVKLETFNESGGGGFGGEKVTAEIVDIERID